MPDENINDNAAITEEGCCTCDECSISQCYGESIPGILGDSTADNDTISEIEAEINGDVYARILGPVPIGAYNIEDFNVYISYEDARNKLTVAYANGAEEQTDKDESYFRIVSEIEPDNLDYESFYIDLDASKVQLARGTYVIRSCYDGKEINLQYLTIKTHPAMGSRVNDKYLATAFPRGHSGDMNGTLTHKNLKIAFSRLARSSSIGGGSGVDYSKTYAKIDASNLTGYEDAWKKKLGYLTEGENVLDSNTLSIIAGKTGAITKFDQFGRTVISQEFTTLPATLTEDTISKFSTMVFLIEAEVEGYSKSTIKYTVDNGVYYKEYITGDLEIEIDATTNSITINAIKNLVGEVLTPKGVEITVLGNTNSSIS